MTKVEPPNDNDDTAAPHVSVEDLVPPEQARLRQDPHRVLRLTVGERTYENVRPVRCFPVSGKADYVSFLDARGREVALVPCPHRLDAESRRVLEEALDRMYYVPRITRIDSITESQGVARWRVQTDRGYAAFEVVDRDHVRRVGPRRFVIEDADGNRFEVPDVDRLDERSRALMESET